MVPYTQIYLPKTQLGRLFSSGISFTGSSHFFIYSFTHLVSSPTITLMRTGSRILPCVIDTAPKEWTCWISVMTPSGVPDAKFQGLHPTHIYSFMSSAGSSGSGPDHQHLSSSYQNLNDFGYLVDPLGVEPKSETFW